MKETVLKGVGASGGVALGQIRMLRRERVISRRSEISIGQEHSRYEEAKRISTDQIVQLVKVAQERLGREEAAIFEAHLLMLKDPEFDAGVKRIISAGDTAESAVEKTTDGFILAFGSIEDPYLKARISDLKDIGARMVGNLGRIGMDGTYRDEQGDIPVDEKSLPDERMEILYAEDLTPSDTLKIDRSRVAGFITAGGSTASHSAIIARTIGIPAIVAAGDLSGILSDGLVVAINGEQGIIHVSPEGPQLSAFKEAIVAQITEREALGRHRVGRTLSRDGVSVELACNIGSPSDLTYVLENDGEGIGLYRSEFLYMDQSGPPGEELQFEAYKDVLSGMSGKPVIIRTLDIGGDKRIPYMDFPIEENPFLGYRAVRYCLENEMLFKTQLRALLRAGCHGNLKIMVPMISGVEEVRRVRSLLKICEEELAAEGTAYSESYELGIMIEVPSAAIIANRLAKEVDFFSIGTNDLIQYTLAADRMNGKVANLYTPFHPAVLRLIRRIVEEGHRAGIWVGMCGEAAGDIRMIPVLLGMGLNELSMNPSKVLKARQFIQTLEVSVWKERVEAVLEMDTAAEVEAALRSWTE